MMVPAGTPTKPAKVSTNGLNINQAVLRHPSLLALLQLHLNVVL